MYGNVIHKDKMWKFIKIKQQEEQEKKMCESKIFIIQIK